MNLSAPGKRDGISRFLTGNSRSEGPDSGNLRIAGMGRKCHICPMARTKENLKAASAKVVSERLGVSAALGGPRVCQGNDHRRRTRSV